MQASEPRAALGRRQTFAVKTFACLNRGTRYRRAMRLVGRLIFFILLLAGATAAGAASGKVVKVLPHFLDLQGRHTLSPSLFDRDAYQAQLRRHPEQRSGMRFDILWRGRSATVKSATLRLELRGTVKGNLPSQLALETPVQITGISRWSALKLDGEAYRNFGEVTAWRVTLWNGTELVGEQKSFLW